jgi:hypothetical protein
MTIDRDCVVGVVTSDGDCVRDCSCVFDLILTDLVLTLALDDDDMTTDRDCVVDLVCW